jgi:hypothetical protein
MAGVNRAVQLAEQTRIAGSYLLTASSATRQAQAPPGERYTAFTGELIRLLENGLPGSDSLIEAGRIYEHLYAELRSKGRPLPQQRLSNTGRTLAFARNRYGAGTTALPGNGHGHGTSTEPSDLPRTPEPYASSEPPPRLRLKPREIAQEISRARSRDTRTGTGTGADAGAGAGDLLLEWSTGRPVQEVATLAALFGAEEKWEESDAVNTAVVTRGPQDIAAYVDALYAMDDAPPNVERLLRRTAGERVEAVAATFKALRATGRRADADRLLALRTERLRHTDEVLELAGALWSAGLDPEADRVFTVATADSPEEAGRLADALLAIGQRDRAFALYLRTPDPVVSRPAGAFVRVLAAMDGADRGEAVTALLQRWMENAAVNSAEAPTGSRRAEAVVELCSELRTAGLNPYALSVLRQSAAALPPAELIALAERLHGQGRGEERALLLRLASHTGPVGAVAGYIDSLREMGRPVDANALLHEVVGMRTPQDVCQLAQWLESHGRDRDRDRLLGAAVRLPAPARIALLGEPLFADGRHDDIAAALLPASDTEFAEVLDWIRDTGSHLDLIALFTGLARKGPEGLSDGLAWMEREKVPESLVLRAWMSGSGTPVEGWATALTNMHLDRANRAQPPEALALLLATLLALGREKQAARVTRRLSKEMWSKAAPLVDLLTALRRRELDDSAREIVRGSPLEPIHVLIDTVTGLSRADLPDDAAYALRCYAFRLGTRAKRLAASLGLEPPPTAAYLPILRRRRLDD